MSSLDVAALLTPLSEDAPCGEDLEYDPDFVELERLAQFKEEQQFGDTVVEAEEPDWKALQKQAMGLLERSRDLRVATRLAPSLVRAEGFTGLRDVMALIEGYIESFWDSVHPQLDPDDDNDPTFRVNTINSLNDFPSMIRGIQTAALVSAPMVGSFSLRDLMLANGEIDIPEGSDEVRPDPAHINGAFADADQEALSATAAAIQECVDRARSIEARFAEHVGASESPHTGTFVEALEKAAKAVNDGLAVRGGGSVEAEAASGAGAADPGAGGSAAGPRLSGEINSRDDVIRAIDKICSFYEKAEPSSPIPLLMKRARGLVAKDFMALVENLTPSGLTEIQSIRGPMEESADSGGSEDSGW